MLNYLLRRFILLFPTLLGVTFITFLLIRLIPGDPALGLVGERANPETISSIRKEIGAEKPFFIQYLGYLKLISKGEMGRSYYTNRKVIQDIKEKFPNTLRLAMGAIVLASCVGIILGIIMAVSRGKLWDRLGSFLAIAGVSLPVFWVGLILMLIFSFILRLFPPSGMGGGSFIYLILPASTLGLNSAAYIARITRSSFLEVLSSLLLPLPELKDYPNGW